MTRSTLATCFLSIDTTGMYLSLEQQRVIVQEHGLHFADSEYRMYWLTATRHVL